MARFHPAGEIQTHLAASGTHTVILDEGDTAWDPTSTKGRDIHGPATVQYTQHADGGIDATVRW